MAIRPHLLALVLAAPACGDDVPPPPVASGALVLDLTAEEGHENDDAAIDILTEVEVLKSRLLAERVVQRLALDRHLGGPEPAIAKVRRSVRASRRDGTRVLDVGIDLDDRELARQVCNALLDSYLERRLEDRVVEVDRQIAALDRAATLLEGSNEERAHVQAELAALTARRQAIRADARILEPCRVLRSRQ